MAWAKLLRTKVHNTSRRSDRLTGRALITIDKLSLSSVKAVTAMGGMAKGRLVNETNVRTASGCCQPPSSQKTAPCKDALDRPNQSG